MRAWVLPASAMLHIALLAAVLPWPPGGGAGPAEAPPIEVELIQQSDATQGGPTQGSPTQSRPTQSSAAVDAARTPQPLADPKPQDAEAPPQPVASPRAEPGPASSAAVNLGDADESRDGIDVTGRGVVPPGPDSAYRNQPPTYPIEAARIGAQGTVSLLVHVSAQGLPQDIVIASSSGVASLDRAARNAVRRWHFTPARLQGTPVPFDYPLDIRFILGDRQ